MTAPVGLATNSTVMTPLLGDFEIVEEIGRGGMATVFSGIHSQLRTPVALKVMKRHQHDEDGNRDRRFAKEVEAVARLQHPGVVMVFDHGTVDEEAANHHRLLEVGMPWLAMEYCGGGTLADAQFETWPEIRSVLVSTLEALAYTHARGVLHRDLKPANVLIADEDDARPGIKLADFGLAVASDEEVTAVRQSLGTPHYMAPEQVEGRWRDFNSATDLYAFGCMAWRLLTGRPPFFRGDSQLTDVLLSQLKEPPPRFFPLFAVPKDMEPWLRRLLHKNPSRRFLMAADALAALPGLDEDLSETANSPFGGDRGLAEPTIPLDDDLTIVDRIPLDDLGLPELRETSGRGEQTDSGFQVASVVPAPMAQARPAPMPERWHRPGTVAAESRLLGAGLALFGLRSVPLVGRDEDRDLLWETLGRVHRDGKAEAVLLHGDAGCGKSRLAQWICRQAHAAGVALPLVASHSEGQNPGQGLSGMISSALRCNNLEGATLADRLQSYCEEWGVAGDFEWRALSQLIQPGQEHATIRFNTPQERYAVVFRLLRRLASVRPMVLVIEDVQWGSDTLFFVEDLLDRCQREDLPLLLLLTARTEAMKKRHFLGHRLKRLATEDRLDIRLLAPLSSAEIKNLIGELLGLERSLVDQVASRSEGNPLFAVQLVGDWVARGVLVPGKRGFQLALGETARVPDDVWQIWRQRLEEMKSDSGDSSQIGLELAAVLGRQVDDAEWRALCAHQGVAVPDLLAERLFKAGLALPTDTGWSFCHALFQESLERTAIDAGRWRSHHQAAASVLEQHLGRDAAGRARRLGTHLLTAEAYSGAIGQLWQAADQHFRGGELVIAEEILDQINPALDALGLPEDHAWRFDQALRRLHLSNLRGRSADHRGELDRLVKWARTMSEDERLTRACNLGGRLLEHSGDLEAALDLLQLGLERSQGHKNLRASCLSRLSQVHLRQGQLEAAERCARQGLELLEQLGDRQDQADMLQSLASILRNQGHLSDAATMLNEAIEISRDEGCFRSQARQINSLAEVFRADGRLSDALDCYKEAGSLAHQLEDALLMGIITCNSGLVLLEMERMDEAEPYLEEADDQFRRAGKHYFATITQAGLLACAAARGDEEEVLMGFEDIRETLARTGAVEMDLALCLQLAGRILARQERYGTASVVLSFALNQWDRLGLADHRERCRRDLEATGATVER